MPNKLEEAGISWAIIGSQTKPYRPPEISDVQEIVGACDKAKLPVFLKDSLNCCALSDYPAMLTKNGNMRQEMPEGK